MNRWTRWLLILWSVFGLLLFGCTRWLWLTEAEFPAVPLFSWLNALPSWPDNVASGVIVLALLVVAGRAGRGRKFEPATSTLRIDKIAILIFLLATSWLLLGNQHRLQPWAVQWGLMAFIFVALPKASWAKWLRWLAASIYFWSAIAKMDHEFLHSLGQQILLALAACIGLDASDWPFGVRLAMAASFPAAELLVAVGFIVPALHRGPGRWVFFALVTLMHVLLILVLSPLGLNHQPAVLIWNTWFIAQAFLLLVWRPKSDEAGQAQPADRYQSLTGELAEVLAEFALVAALCLPVLNLVGRWDHWPAWGLYAPRNSRATLFIREQQTDRIPEPLQAYLASQAEAGWRRFQLDRWSLDTVNVPIYPQDRFQLGVAEALIRRFDLGDHFQIVLERPPDRFTGRRPKVAIRSRQELRQQLGQFWLNGNAHLGP